MKFLLLLLLAAPLAAQTNGLSLLSVGRVASLQLPATPATPLTPYASDDFEGAGSVLTWVEEGDGLPDVVIDFDYATDPPAGSHALLVSTANATGSIYYATASYAKTEVRFILRIDRRVNTPALLSFRNGVTTLGTVFITSGNRLRCSASGGSSNDSTSVIPTGEDIYFWAEYWQGSGADAQMRAGWSRTADKKEIITTGAFSCQSVNGTRTTQPTRLYFQSDSVQDADFVIDELELSEIP